jgi:transcriptional repressor NrdR
MVCIYCSAETKVINSRHQKRANTVWRRRRCINCGSIITTEEIPKYETALMVRGDNGALEPFSRDLLLISLYKSLAHRKTAAQDAAALTTTLISLLRAHSDTEAIMDRDALIGSAHSCLQRFDTAAASHYLAYHPESLKVS